MKSIERRLCLAVNVETLPTKFGSAAPNTKTDMEFFAFHVTTLYDPDN